MRKPSRTILIAGGAAVLAIGGFTASTALAGTSSAPAVQPKPGTWSVTPINTDLGDGSVGPAVLTDTTTGGKIKCAGGDGDIDVKGGMGLTGTLAEVAFQIGRCTLSDGTAVTVTANAGPWAMIGTSFYFRPNLGVTTGEWTGVDLSFSGTSCSGSLDGTAAGADDGVLQYQHYNNPGFLILRKLGSNLNAYDVSGCAGLFNSGDPVSVVATLDTGMTITSP
jgi:hypothetical protein